MNQMNSDESTILFCTDFDVTCQFIISLLIADIFVAATHKNVQFMYLGCVFYLNTSIEQMKHGVNECL